MSYYTVFTPLAWTYRESSVSLAIAENLNGTSGLKPESSISYSGIDALKRLRRRSFLLSQLAWSRYKHEHRLCSLSLLSHHHNLHDNALSVITTVPVCFCGASMRYYLANRRNAHGDAAGFCLAAPWIYVSGRDLGEQLPCVHDTRRLAERAADPVGTPNVISNKLQVSFRSPP